MSDDALVRNYTMEDFETIKRIHEANWPGYAVPNFNSDYLYPFKQVLQVGDRVVAAGLCSMEIETHMFIDRTWGDPLQKLAAIRNIQDVGLKDMAAHGIKRTYATIHGDLEKSYAKRLRQLGWVKSAPGWSMWFRDTEK